MALTRILLWLGNTFVICAVLLTLTAMAGLLLGEVSYAVIFAALTLPVGITGSLIIIATHNTPARETNSDALAFLLLFWTVLPVLAAIPYYATGSVSHVSTAYFEAVSALTTTGASSLNADDLPRILHIWRSVLQFFGGVSAATFAVVILAALNLSGTGIHRSMLFTLKKGELFERLIGIGRIIVSIYLGLAALCFSLLLLSGTPLFESLCLSLTSVSTGGLTPRSGPLASYVSPFGVTILSCFCLSGAVSIAVLWDFIRLRGAGGRELLWRNAEHRALIAMIGLIIILGLAYISPRHAGTLIPEAFFFVSSTGFDYNVIGIEMLPPTLLIALALVGGAALSTTGGLKMIRLLLLFRHLTVDLSRLSHPSRVLPVTFRGQVLSDRDFLSIWMYFFGFTLVFGAGIVALGAAGLPYDIAVASAAASLANMGPLLDATLPISSYSDFTLPQQFISSVIMLFGRVEVLAGFAAITGVTWQRA
ncbi:MAG: TrkH family potassium uptake protein [Maricaulaceae bacterium]